MLKGRSAEHKKCNRHDTTEIAGKSALRSLSIYSWLAIKCLKPTLQITVAVVFSWVIAQFGVVFSGILPADISVLQSGQSKANFFNCSTWDTHYIDTFETGLIITVLVVFLLVVVTPTGLGKRYWVLTRRWLRTIFLGLTGGIVMAAIYIGVPQVTLGVLPYESVSPQYLQCGSDFEPDGFLNGLIGAGTKAINQIPLMILLISLATVIGVLLAIITGSLVKRGYGLESRVK